MNLLHLLEKYHTFALVGEEKVAKITLLLHLVHTHYQARPVIFSPQESSLFKKRLTALLEAHDDLKAAAESLHLFTLRPDWSTLKQHYGFEIFLEELRHLIARSEEPIVVFHRFEEFFEFQDRFHIRQMITELIRTAENHQKRIFFLLDSDHENFRFVYDTIEEVCEVEIEVRRIGEGQTLRLLFKNLLTHVTEATLRFKPRDGGFAIEKEAIENARQEEALQTRVLLVELDSMDEDIVAVVRYILKGCSAIQIESANSIQSMLEGIFLGPDIILVFMNRSEENFNVLKSIKQRLPKTRIITVINQDFIRSEDRIYAYAHGCDELLPRTFSLDDLILSVDKATANTMLTRRIEEALEGYPNRLPDYATFKELAEKLHKASIYFTVFVLECPHPKGSFTQTNRRGDFLYFDGERNIVYYLAVNTLPRNIYRLVDQIGERCEHHDLLCLFEPIHHLTPGNCLP